MIGGVRISDSDLDGMQEDTVRKEDILGEGVVLDDDEWEVIKQPPKKAIYERLELMRMNMDAAEGNTKQRWSRQKEKETADLSELEKKQEEEMDIEGRQVYSKIENLMDYRRMRITDTGKHRRTYMAKELTVEEEAKLEVQRNMWMKVYREYMEENCDKDGILTEQQKRGLKKLSKRIKDGEIVVTKTDKSGRFFVSMMEDYREKGMVHVGRDREISRKEVKEIERRLNGLAEIWIKCFQAGKDHGLTNEGRIRSGYKTNAGVVPPLYTRKITNQGRKENHGLHHVLFVEPALLPTAEPETWSPGS